MARSRRLSKGKGVDESSAGITTTAEARCHFFRSPPELRNRIYQLTFPDTPDEVDLLNANPPSKALLLTCRQAYQDVRFMYRKAFCDFWSQPRFFIRLPPNEITTISALKIKAAAARFKEDDLAHVQVFRMQMAGKPQVCTYAGGFWSSWIPDGHGMAMKQHYHEMWAPKSKEGALKAAGFRTMKLRRREWLAMSVRGRRKERIEEARRIVGLKGLTVEQLLVALIE